MIQEEICTYEVCKLAKEKGFNVPTAKNYRHENGTTCNAPTQSLLQRWLREEKGYYVYPLFDNVQLKWDWVCREKIGDKWIPLVGYDFHLFDTYELALEDALKYALENLV
jgi:hypothetical protein